MKTIYKVFIGVVLTLGYLVLTKAQEKPKTFSNLIKVSDTDYLDLSRVTMIQFPVYRQRPEGCDDCQTRWGQFMIVDGVKIDYSEETEVLLHQMIDAR